MELVETKLARLARDGDRTAFQELVDLYKDKIYHLAYRMLGNSHEGEDVVQDTFLRVFTNLHKYDDNHKFSTWIYRIGTNLCIDRLRKRKTSLSLDSETVEGETMDGYGLFPTTGLSPEQLAISSEITDQIRTAIEKLPAKYKTIMKLRYLQDYTLQEISQLVGMPVTTVKTRVHRGREFLRKRLNREHFI